MNKNSSKTVLTRLTTALMVIVLCFSIFTSQPYKAHAVIPNIDVYNGAISTFNGIGIAASTAFDALGIDLQTVLRSLAIAALKTAQGAIAQSTINWINNGFEGNPGFVTNIRLHMRGLADSVAQGFFNELAYGIGINSPYKDDLVRSLRNEYLFNSSDNAFAIRNKYDLCGNSPETNQRFIGGDFNSGGIRCWMRAWGTPSGNFFSAYRGAMNELTKRISQALSFRAETLKWGQGLLSWCESQDSLDGKQISADLQAQGQAALNASIADLPTFTYDGQSAESIAAGQATQAQLAANSQAPANLTPPPQGGEAGCTMQTPGSIIQDRLSEVMGSDIRELETGVDIDRILLALVNQITKQAFGAVGGLLGASEPGNGGGGRPTLPGNIVNDNLDVAFNNAIQNTRKKIDDFKLNWKTIQIAAEAAKTVCSNSSASIEKKDLVDKTLSEADRLTAKADSAISVLDTIAKKIAESQKSTSAAKQGQLVQEATVMYTTLQTSGALPSPEETQRAYANSKPAPAGGAPTLVTQMNDISTRGCN